jgi:type I restriction enzyme, S subunit
MTGNCRYRLGEIFTKRSERSAASLPLLSVTLDNGIVDRESLDRKLDTDLAPDEHLLVRQGDLVYNMMRMWQGASGIATRDGIVSPAYVVLAPDSSKVDPLFASFLFKTRKMLYQFWAQSYGLTDDRLRLYFKDFARISITIPPLPYQREAARILHLISKCASLIPALIRARVDLKRHVADHLFRGVFDGAGERVSFGKMVTLCQSRYDPQGAGGEQAQLCIELDDILSELGAVRRRVGPVADDASSKVRFRSGDVLYGKLRPYLRKFLLTQFEGVCSSEIWVLRPKPVISPSFLFYLAQTSRFSRCANVSAGSKMPRAEWNMVARMALSLPTLTDQQGMIAPLIAMDNEIHYLMDLRERLDELKNGLLFDRIERVVEIH